MRTIKKSMAWLAVLLSCLLAVPPAVLADDTELFTTRANPNVLLMIDTTGSMESVSGSTGIGDLDGSGTSNTRMDILWKVVYTLLNADLSIPSSTATWTCRTSVRYGAGTSTASIQVNGANWSSFPASATIQVGGGGTAESFTYYRKRISGGKYYFDFSPSITFAYTHSRGSTVSYSATTGLYSQPYPTNYTEAMSTDFLSNLAPADESILKARIGLLTFTTDPWATSNQIIIRNQVGSTSPNAPPFASPTRYRDIWSSITSYAYASGGTPTSQALYQSMNFFNTAYNAGEICRKNFAVMITDGEDTMGFNWGDGSGYGPMYYKSGSSYSYTYVGGATFNSDGWPGYYSDGTPFNSGQVLRNNQVVQQAAWLWNQNPSVNLYTVGVGVSNTEPALNVMRDVLRRAAEQNGSTATQAEYDAIGASGDNTSRAANKAFFATDAAELAAALTNIFQQITGTMYSFTAPTVASVRMTDRNYLYMASFSPAVPPATYWEGHLKAYTVNTDNTTTFHWDADNVLASTAEGDRRIFTADNTWSRIAFTTSTVTPAMLAVDNTAARDNVVNYVRGVGRTAKLGDIFHSKPVVVGPPSRFFFDDGYSTAVGATQSFADAKAHRRRVVYAGTNDGMLHAFLSGTWSSTTGLYDNGTGEELFGFVPYNVLDDLKNFVPGDLTSHGYYVDSSPRVADVWIDANADGIKQSSEWHTVLIGGLRKGGNGYYALDITDPPDGTDYTNYPKVLWEYTDPANVAQTWSEPFIGKVRMKETTSSAEKDRWVAIFGGGRSDAGNLGAALVVLDIATGTPLTTFTTGIDNVIPASPTAVLDAAGYIKFVYAADLDGSLYKFDFRTTGVRSNGFSDWAVYKIFQTAAGGQPVYQRVEAASVDESTRYLFFGTGDRENPVTNTGSGKFYCFKDTDGFAPASPITETTAGAMTDLSSSIASSSGGTMGNYGWFIRFAGVPSTANDTYTHSGEKVLSDPVIFYNSVYFTTYTPDTSNPCSGGGTARVYGLGMLTAGAALQPIASLGETGTSKLPYHVYGGRGIPSSPSLSINPAGQSSLFVGFSTGVVDEIKVDSPSQSKTIKSWKELF
ncbi:MAG: PilC/PilY family type IV pilus protein [Deltaproteobacteria bacterium]|nr:PilC/PilY family type IV pilus protein [Deltaproteobacteria bacterium]